MTDADKTTFAQHLFLAGEVFNEPVSEARATAYFAVLADLEIDDVVTAITYAMRESRWFPRPADIRHTIMGTHSDEADVEWGRLFSGADKTLSVYVGMDPHDFKQLSLNDKMRLREPFRRAYIRDLEERGLDQVKVTTRQNALPSPLTPAQSGR